jgi:hypothetical protein
MFGWLQEDRAGDGYLGGFEKVWEKAKGLMGHDA